MLRAAVERWLQVAIEACIDIATHVLASEGWTPAGSARDAFLVLANHGKIPLELAQRLGSAAGMRNVLVHDYVCRRPHPDRACRAARPDRSASVCGSGRAVDGRLRLSRNRRAVSRSARVAPRAALRHSTRVDWTAPAMVS
jgi:hypothetical protein